MITLRSPDGQFFRRIGLDGFFEERTKDGLWVPHDPAHIDLSKVTQYVDTLTEHFGWKIEKQTNVATPAIYTTSRIREAARSHAAYGWARSYAWNVDRSPWTDAQKAIYDEAYTSALRK